MLGRQDQVTTHIHHFSDLPFTLCVDENSWSALRPTATHLTRDGYNYQIFEKFWELSTIATRVTNAWRKKYYTFDAFLEKVMSDFIHPRKLEFRKTRRVPRKYQILILPLSCIW